MQTEVKSDKRKSLESLSKGYVYRKYVKRAMDLILSLLAIIILSPLLLVVALLVTINFGSPIIFKQRRPGLNERIFTIYKFRTMADITNEKGELLSDEFRLTRFGKILRSTSIDELPELFNILKGDMSIVGPRPLLVQYLSLYNFHQKRRHEVRPGLTGLAQINGRNLITWEERFDLDVSYIDNISFTHDLKIILMTLTKVFTREGINSSKSKTMELFKGTANEEKINKLVIVGVGGFGREVAWLVERINKEEQRWHLIGFIDDNEDLRGTMVNGYPVLGSCNWLKEQQEEIYVVCAIGSSKSRKKVIEKLSWLKFATLIDPKAEIADKVIIGEGSIICAGTIVTVNIDIGSHVIINLSCTIGHDAVIKDFVTLNPSVNLSGNTVLGECVEVGTGTQVIQGVEVGDGAIVGAGAVVVRELPPKCTAVGIPAKPIKFFQ